MQSFKTFIAESRTRLNTPAEILAAIKQYDNEPEILNPDFNHIKEQAGYRFRDADKPLRDLCVATREMRHDGPYGDYWHYPAEVEAVMDAIPYGYTSFTKLKKALEKAKAYKDIYKAGQDFVTTWEAIGEGLKSLKAKSVKVATKRAEAKAVQQASFDTKKSNSEAMIKALEAHRKEYVDAAVKQGTEFLDKVFQNLAKHDWDLNQYIPRTNYPSRIDSARRSLVMSITTGTSSSRSPKDPDIRKKDTQGVNRYLDNVKKDATANYDAFVAKMVTKVGDPVVDAKLTGSIWTNATLTVKTVKGEEQVWTTKAIINFSKYQKMFNQFPTRRKK